MDIKKIYFDSLNYNLNTAFSFLVLEQPSRFVITYIYKESHFCLATLLFFNYCLF